MKNDWISVSIIAIAAAVIVIVTLAAVHNLHARDAFLQDCANKGGTIQDVEHWGGKWRTHTYICTDSTGKILGVR